MSHPIPTRALAQGRAQEGGSEGCALLPARTQQSPQPAPRQPSQQPGTSLLLISQIFFQPL